MNEELVQRLRDPRQRRTTLHHDAADEIERLRSIVERVTSANQAWLEKWEKLQCEFCGTSSVMKDGDTA